MSTFKTAIHNHAERFPDRVALSDGVSEVTYGQLLARAEEYGAAMLGSKHNVFCVYAGNDSDTIAALYGASLAGKTLATIPDFVPRPFAQLARMSIGAKPIRWDSKNYDFPGGGTFVVFTSGTTGKPKALVQPKVLVERPLTAMYNAVGIMGGERVFTTAPVTAAPVTYLILLSMGCTVSFTRDVRPTPEDILEGFLRSRATRFHCTPSILDKLHNTVGLGKFVGLDSIMTASMPFPPSLVNKLQGTGIKITDVYASSETGPIGYRNPMAEDVFTFFPGVEGFAGEDGELLVLASEHTSPGIMSRRGIKSLGTMIPNGDVVSITDGKIDFLSREKSRVKVSGFAVNLEILKDVALAVPGVTEVNLSVTRSDKSDSITMKVNSDPKIVREYLEESLPWYYIPRDIYDRRT